MLSKVLIIDESHDILRREIGPVVASQQPFLIYLNAQRSVRIHRRFGIVLIKQFGEMQQCDNELTGLLWFDSQSFFDPLKILFGG
jgi:cytidylate kinase